MAKRKAKKPEFAPSPYEGFRATTREADRKVEVFMSMTGDQGALEDILVARYEADVIGRGEADLAFLFTQVVSLILNAGMPLEELDRLWRVISALGAKYRVELPPDWTCMTVTGLDFSDYQLTYVKPRTGDVVVVEPDSATTLTTLEDIVFQGRQNIVAPGRAAETAKIQHQPDRRKKKSNQG